MRFDVSTNYKLSKEILDNFKKIVASISEIEGIDDDVFFEVNIIDNDRMQEINLTYRKIDKPTDVISFGMWGDKLIKTALLGEIFISYEQSIIQAKEYEHSFVREISFLLTHGIFHLLGYNHIKREDEIVMIRKQELIMKLLDNLKGEE